VPSLTRDRATHVETHTKIPLLISVVVTAISLGHLVYVAQLPQPKWITFVPDDAFYYWNFALNANESGVWSLNSQDPSTGFHILFAYLMRLVNLVTSDVQIGFLLISLMAVIALSVSSFLVATIVERIWGSVSAIASAIPFVTPAALNQTTFMMESWLIILLSALLVFWVSSPGTRTPWILLGAIGLLGTLTRTDFIVFALSMGLTVFLPATRFVRPQTQRVLFFVGGSILGLALVALHTFFLSGYLEQGSTSTKAHWATISGRTLNPGIEIIVGTLVPPASRFVVAALVLGAVVLTFLVWGVTWRRASTVTFLHPFGLLALGGFTVAYFFNSEGIQPWYQANFLIPISLILAGITSLVVSKPVVLLVVTGVGFYVALNFVRGAYTTPVWAFQEGMLAASLSDEVESLPSDALIGSWNAGIHATFSDRTIVNLDGLANNDASDAVIAGALTQYLDRRGVTHILDFEQMITDDQLGLRGGYSTVQLATCLVKLARVDAGIPSWTGSPLNLYEVVPGCLSDQELTQEVEIALFN